MSEHTPGPESPTTDPVTDTVTTATGTGTEPTSGRHPVHIAHLVMGTAFLGLLLVWALIVGDLVEGAEVRWLMPVPWVAAGAAGVLATVLPRRSTR